MILGNRVRVWNRRRHSILMCSKLLKQQKQQCTMPASILSKLLWNYYFVKLSEAIVALSDFSFSVQKAALHKKNYLE